MRVIAGTARRTPLIAPAGIRTRPTSDRAREGLFNIIGTRITGARFLDLFCGSGAVGIEALSRGAGEAVFAEQARPPWEALKKNLLTAKFMDNSEILYMTAAEAVDKLRREGRRFDFIFLDPPYGEGLIEKTLPLLAGSGASVLMKDGCIIAETEASLPAPEANGLVLAQQRDYGRTRFLFYRLGEAE
jgi:16S rRNA (guanine(966)-N(2))-methyltransferase RsmD